mmetsp:Transcript_95926/g.271194  ORF Transcript_95926/g.271194 Transcript_95926/m.271194 type:complete len:114 (+) Transcript_95926:215-556(+)
MAPAVRQALASARGALSQLLELALALKQVMGFVREGAQAPAATVVPLVSLPAAPSLALASVPAAQVKEPALVQTAAMPAPALAHLALVEQAVLTGFRQLLHLESMLNWQPPPW